MKNILIFGTSRAGKTTLAKRLQGEFALNVINWDFIIQAFADTFPQLEIIHNGDKTDKNITPFAANYICELAENADKKTGSFFVADMTCYVFEQLFTLMEERLSYMGEYFIFIQLDDSRTSEEMFCDVRRYDTEDDWTYSLSDTDLRNWCESQQKKTNELTNAKMKELNFLRYDVAQGREQVFDKIISNIREIIK